MRRVGTAECKDCRQDSSHLWTSGPAIVRCRAVGRPRASASRLAATRQQSTAIDRLWPVAGIEAIQPAVPLDSVQQPSTREGRSDLIVQRPLTAKARLTRYDPEQQLALLQSCRSWSAKR